MLNEFVYCQRLFYYEFVEGVFVESVDTLRGDAIHKRVDSGNGALPAAKKKAKKTTQDEPAATVESPIKEAEPQNAEPETIHSRSVQMGSERLGVVAKMDLVEGSKTGKATTCLLRWKFARLTTRLARLKRGKKRMNYGTRTKCNSDCRR